MGRFGSIRIVSDSFGIDRLHSTRRQGTQAAIALRDLATGRTQSQDWLAFFKERKNAKPIRKQTTKEHHEGTRRRSYPRRRDITDTRRNTRRSCAREDEGTPQTRGAQRAPIVRKGKFNKRDTVRRAPSGARRLKQALRPTTSRGRPLGAPTKACTY